MYNLEKLKREEAILLSLKKLDFLSRNQIQRIHRLGGARNTNKVLKEMGQYLSTFRSKENVYYLNKEGRDRVESKKICKISSKLPHYLMRNELYIYFGFPSTWENEMKIKTNDAAVIADAIFQKDNLWHFVEIDNEQKMSVNRKKVELYRKLHQTQPFKLVWLTSSDVRKRKLNALCGGIKSQILTMNDIQ